LRACRGLMFKSGHRTDPHLFLMSGCFDRTLRFYTHRWHFHANTDMDKSETMEHCLAKTPTLAIFIDECCCVFQFFISVSQSKKIVFKNI
jgi:hypothetical protein